MKVGLGILTCERLDYLRQVTAGVSQHLRGVVDELVVYHDGPAPRNLMGAVDPLLKPVQFVPDEFTGVATGKNALMVHLLDRGCDVIFISEDDVVVQSPLAVAGYTLSMAASGWGHLAFHAHGPANDGGPVEGAEFPPGVTYWPNYVGAWCCYTREALTVGGLMDGGFSEFCHFEHVEHTLRLAMKGFHPLPREWGCPLAADATGSENWIAEIPGSIEDSVIANRPESTLRYRAAKRYWAEAHPDTYQLLWRLP